MIGMVMFDFFRCVAIVGRNFVIMYEFMFYNHID